MTTSKLKAQHVSVFLHGVSHASFLTPTFPQGGPFPSAPSLASAHQRQTEGFQTLECLCAPLGLYPRISVMEH